MQCKRDGLLMCHKQNHMHMLQRQTVTQFALHDNPIGAPTMPGCVVKVFCGHLLLRHFYPWSVRSISNRDQPAERPCSEPTLNAPTKQSSCTRSKSQYETQCASALPGLQYACKLLTSSIMPFRECHISLSCARCILAMHVCHAMQPVAACI
jgi:hypothetical protein